jgi:hypothetical protein
MIVQKAESEERLILNNCPDDRQQVTRRICFHDEPRSDFQGLSHHLKTLV